MRFSVTVSFRALFAALALVVAASGAALAAEKCDVLVSHAAGLESARTAIDDACPCEDFDGSDGNERVDFKRCIGGQIKLSLEAFDLPKSCTAVLKKMYSASICGRGDSELAPCVETSTSGKVRCKITTATACYGRSGDACVGSPTCVDAADTTGDMVIDADDSGVCILVPTTSTSTTTTTFTTTTTTTTLPPPPPPSTTTSTTSTTDTTSTTHTTSTTDTTSTTMPLLCGDDGPAIHVEINRATDTEEEVSRSTSCPPQNPSGGGCPLMNILDGSAEVINFFYADETTDERVCSQDDAALSYHWEILFPPTLQGALFQEPWITGYDSPVLRIPPGGLPSLDDTDAGADTFWRIRLTITPLPLEGEEITPAPKVLYFRFKYQQTEMSLQCYDWYLTGQIADGCRAACLVLPELCQ